MITHGRRSGGSDGGSPVGGRLAGGGSPGVDGSVGGGRSAGIAIVASETGVSTRVGSPYGSWSDMVATVPRMVEQGSPRL